MSNSAEERVGVYKRLSIPRVCASDWDPGTAKLASRELRRLRGELASAEAVLVGVMKTETGRDTTATQDAIDLADDPRTDLYAAIQTTDGAVMKFGRSRRLASALQKLALALREHGTCAYPGCTTPWDRCDADHDPPWDKGGLTDINKMKLMWTNGHHTHRHETGHNITRQPNGNWTVDNEPIEPWPPPPPKDDDHVSIAHAREACLKRLRHVRCRLRHTGSHTPDAEGDTDDGLAGAGADTS